MPLKYKKFHPRKQLQTGVMDRRSFQLPHSDGGGGLKNGTGGEVAGRALLNSGICISNIEPRTPNRTDAYKVVA